MSRIFDDELVHKIRYKEAKAFGLDSAGREKQNSGLSHFWRLICAGTAPPELDVHRFLGCFEQYLDSLLDTSTYSREQSAKLEASCKALIATVSTKDGRPLVGASAAIPSPASQHFDHVSAELSDAVATASSDTHSQSPISRTPAESMHQQPGSAATRSKRTPKPKVPFKAGPQRAIRKSKSAEKFIVELIVCEALAQTGPSQLYVKWLGYAEPTWEPFDPNEFPEDSAPVICFRRHTEHFLAWKATHKGNNFTDARARLVSCLQTAHESVSSKFAQRLQELHNADELSEEELLFLFAISSFFGAHAASKAVYSKAELLLLCELTMNLSID